MGEWALPRAGCLGCAAGPDTLDLAAHASHQHVAHHSEIADEGPEGKAETGRLVLFDNEVGKPREGIADDKECREEIPLAACDEKDQKRYAERGPDKEQQTGLRL